MCLDFRPSAIDLFLNMWICVFGSLLAISSIKCVVLCLTVRLEIILDVEMIYGSSKLDN